MEWSGDRWEAVGVRFVSRLREIAAALTSARFPAPPKRRYDLITEAVEQVITGEGGGRGAVRKGGVSDEPDSDRDGLQKG